MKGRELCDGCGKKRRRPGTRLCPWCETGLDGDSPARGRWWWPLAMIAGAQVLLFCAWAINYRMIAQGRLSAALASDFCLATLNYFLIRRVAEGDGSASKWAAYTFGGMLGTALGMIASR